MEIGSYTVELFMIPQIFWREAVVPTKYYTFFIFGGMKAFYFCLLILINTLVGETWLDFAPKSQKQQNRL